MSSAKYITNASKGKQCESNQTATDLDPHCLPLPIYKLIMSANICSRRFEYRYVFLPVTSLVYYNPLIAYHNKVVFF